MSAYKFIEVNCEESNEKDINFIKVKHKSDLMTIRR